MYPLALCTRWYRAPLLLCIVANEIASIRTLLSRNIPSPTARWELIRQDRKLDQVRQGHQPPRQITLISLYANTRTAFNLVSVLSAAEWDLARIIPMDSVLGLYTGLLFVVRLTLCYKRFTSVGGCHHRPRE